MFLRVRETYEQKRGIDHSDTIDVLNSLAIVYKEQSKYEEAEPLFLRVREIYEQELGVHHPDTAMALNNLASLYGPSRASMGRQNPCYCMFVPSPSKNGELITPTPQILSTLWPISTVIRQVYRGRTLVPTCSCHLRAEAGADHPDTARALHNLATLYCDRGQFTWPSPCSCGSCHLRAEAGAHHPDTANTLNNLAILYRDQSKYGEAEPLFLQFAESVSRSWELITPTPQTL